MKSFFILVPSASSIHSFAASWSIISNVFKVLREKLTWSCKHANPFRWKRFKLNFFGNFCLESWAGDGKECEEEDDDRRVNVVDVVVVGGVMAEVEENLRKVPASS